MYFNAINFIILASIHCIISELVQLSCKHIIAFTNGHNLRRILLLEGKVPGQPKAALMYTMMWDKELSQKAADWAVNNKFAHNPDATIASKRFITGENVHMTLTTKHDREFNTEEALMSWWEEYKYFEYGPMSKKHFEPIKESQVGHYTQMAWANSFYIGCAVSKFKKDDKWTAYLVICYYGPAGNVIGEYPYTTGGEYVSTLQCHESIHDCKDLNYLGCNLYDYNFHPDILRASTNIELDEPEKNITAAAAVLTTGVEVVELHENLMSIPLSNKYTPLQ